MDNESTMDKEQEAEKNHISEPGIGGVSGIPVKGFARRNPVLFTAIVGLLAVVVVYFWKDIQANKQKAAVEKMAEEQLIENTTEMLKLVTKPFVWSIRAELLRENLEQVNMYTKELVREKNFQIVYLIDPEGKITISTDKKLEGQSALDLFESRMLQTDSVVVSKKDDLLTVAAPVMGYDKKLGVIIMSYLPETFKTDDRPLKSDTSAPNK